MKNIYAIKDNFINAFDDKVIVTDLNPEQIARSYEGTIKRAVSKGDKNVNMFDNTGLYLLGTLEEVSGTLSGIDPLLVLDLGNAYKDAMRAYEYFQKQLEAFKKEQENA